VVQRQMALYLRVNCLQETHKAAKLSGGGGARYMNSSRGMTPWYSARWHCACASSACRKREKKTKRRASSTNRGSSRGMTPWYNARRRCT
jgi:hypothetical protein